MHAILSRPGGESRGCGRSEIALWPKVLNYFRSPLPQPWAHTLKLLHLCGLLTPQAVSDAGWVGTHLLDVCDVHQLDHLVPL